MVKRLLSILFFVTVMLINSGSAVAEITLSDLIESLRDRSLAFDTQRIPDSLLKRFFNDEQEHIAITARCIEEDTLIVLQPTSYAYPLPSDFYLAYTAWLNPDPTSGNPRPISLTYVPANQYGSVFSYSTGRPEQWSYWNDSIHINKLSATDKDSLLFKYFGHAQDMDSGGSVMSIPREYKVPLVDRVALRCYKRIYLMLPDAKEIDTTIAHREQHVLERPIDER